MANKIGSLFESDVFDGEDGPYVMLDGQPIFLDDNQIQAMTPIKPSAGPLAPTTPKVCLLYTSPSPRDRTRSRMPSSA